MLATLRWLLFAVAAVVAQCPDHAFLGCILRLKAQRVPFERNMMNLVFSIKTEAKLLHTCKAYSSILPCFREKVTECGDDKQRRMLGEVSKMIMYMCSPFSLKRQRLLIEHQQCVSGVLSLPASTGCKLNDYKDGMEVLSCKRHCANRQVDFLCTMKVWISEQNVCTVKDIEDKCGSTASEFYKDVQQNVFDPEFPVICEKPTEPIPVAENFTTTTADSILIEDFSTTTKLPQEYFNQRGQERKFNVVVTPSPVSVSSTPTRIPTVWTKFPGLRKTEYNKQGWKKKPMTQTEDMVAFRPAMTATLTPIVSSSPRSYKVINILKGFLPQNLPNQLTSLFEKSLEKHSFGQEYKIEQSLPTQQRNIGNQQAFIPETKLEKKPFNPEDHYHTPGSAEVTTETTPIWTPTTTTVGVTIMTPSSVNSVAKRRKPATKWMPWYLGGAPQ